MERDADLHLVFGQVAAHRDGGGLGHRRVLRDRLLHVDRRDVLAPPADVVLLPVDEAEVAVGVEPAEVAGVEPQVPEGRDGGFGVAVVALEHDVGPAGPADDLADLTGRHLPVLGVEQPHLEELVVDLPGGARLERRGDPAQGERHGFADGVERGEVDVPAPFHGRLRARPGSARRARCGRGRRRRPGPRAGSTAS